MDQILIKLLEQTPVIIVLGLCVYVLYRDKKELISGCANERKAHALELKELNEYIRSRDLETLENIEAINQTVRAIKTYIDLKN